MEVHLGYFTAHGNKQKKAIETLNNSFIQTNNPSSTVLGSFLSPSGCLLTWFLHKTYGMSLKDKEKTSRKNKDGISFFSRHR